MLTRLLRVVVLLLAFPSPFLAQGQTREAAPFVVANEAGARLALKEKGSVFSIDLSANLAKPISARFDARIVAPNDKMLARASVPRTAQFYPTAVRGSPKLDPRERSRGHL